MPGLTTDLEAVLIDVVAELLDEVHVDRPPVDACEVARRLGMPILNDAGQTERGRLVRVRSQPLICVRHEPRPERTQWTVAHEIGEHLMPRLLQFSQAELGDLGVALREAVANRFASLLLVPQAWLEFDARMAQFDLLALKALYRTASYEVLAFRLLDLDPPTVISVFDQNRLTRRRSNLCCRPPLPASFEQQAQQAAHRTGQPQRLELGGVVVSAWPIHEPGWKREILRTVVDGDSWDANLPVPEAPTSFAYD